MEKVNKLNNPLCRRCKLLFLGYGKNETKLIDFLIEKKCEVWHTSDKVVSFAGFDLIISFGYRHIIKKDTLNTAKRPIVNLHISYLPYNRGAHPNFWSFYEETPSGVTIHHIDEGIDTGDIIYQKKVQFSSDEITFKQTYNRLINEIEQLFIENADNIIEGNYTPVKQLIKGTYHKVSDLPIDFNGWNSQISEEIKRLKMCCSR